MKKNIIKEEVLNLNILLLFFSIREAEHTGRGKYNICDPKIKGSLVKLYFSVTVFFNSIFLLLFYSFVSLFLLVCLDLPIHFNISQKTFL